MVVGAACLRGGPLYGTVLGLRDDAGRSYAIFVDNSILLIDDNPDPLETPTLPRNNVALQSSGSQTSSPLPELLQSPLSLNIIDART